jgi:hypothetical protein
VVSCPFAKADFTVGCEYIAPPALIQGSVHQGLDRLFYSGGYTIMIERFFIFVCLMLVGCASAREGGIDLVTVDALQAADAPNILSVALKDGQVIQFDKDRGWYDQDHKLVEGRSTEGGEVRLALILIDRLTILRQVDDTEAASSAAPLWLIPILLFLLLGTAVFIFFIRPILGP